MITLITAAAAAAAKSLQSCPTLSDPMDCSPPGSSVHGVFQARVLEWDAIAFSAHGSQPCLIHWSYEPFSAGPPKTDELWWRVLTKHGSMDKEIVNCSNILALRTPWTVTLEGTKIFYFRKIFIDCAYVSGGDKGNIKFGKMYQIVCKI